MQIRKFQLVFFIIIFVWAGTLFAQTPEMISHFDYDKTAPLDLRTVRSEQLATNNRRVSTDYADYTDSRVSQPS